MSTRSTIRVRSKFTENGKIGYNDHVLMYVQSDGYPSGHVLDTAKWLSEGKVVNGLGMNQPPVVFNGCACLAAQLVARYKDGPGGTYLYSLKSRGNAGEDYLYDIIVDEEAQTIEMGAFENGWGKIRTKRIFKGTPEEFVEKYGKDDK